MAESIRSSHDWYHDVITRAEKMKIAPDFIKRLKRANSLGMRTKLANEEFIEASRTRRSLDALERLSALAVFARLDEWMIPLLRKNPNAESEAEIAGESVVQYKLAMYHMARHAFWAMGRLPGDDRFDRMVHDSALCLAATGWRGTDTPQAFEIMNQFIPLVVRSPVLAKAIVRAFRVGAEDADVIRYEEGMKQLYQETVRHPQIEAFKTIYMVLAHGWLIKKGPRDIEDMIRREKEFLQA